MKPQPFPTTTGVDSAVRRTLLDGSVVSLSGDAVFHEGATNHLRLKVGPRVVEFEAGLVDFSDDVAQWLEIEFDEQYDFQDGMLRLGTDISPGNHRIRQLVCWYGAQYSLKLSVEFVEREAMLDVFNQFRIVETDSGIVLQGINRELDSFQMREYPLSLDQPLFSPLAPRLVNLGLLNVTPLTADVANGLPSWQGSQVPAGELFLDGDETEPHSLWLISSTAFAQFSPRELPIRDFHVDIVASLEVEWTFP